MNDATRTTWTDRAIAACNVEFQICAKHQTLATARKNDAALPAERREAAKQSAWHWGYRRAHAERLVCRLQKRAQRRAELAAWRARRAG